jgi:hypothetical protein
VWRSVVLYVGTKLQCVTYSEDWYSACLLYGQACERISTWRMWKTFRSVMENSKKNCAILMYACLLVGCVIANWFDYYNVKFCNNDWLVVRLLCCTFCEMYLIYTTFRKLIGERNSRTQPGSLGRPVDEEGSINQGCSMLTPNINGNSEQNNFFRWQTWWRQRIQFPKCHVYQIYPRQWTMSSMYF